MSKHEIKPLSPEARALLTTMRCHRLPPPEATARLHARIEATLAGIMGGAASPSGTEPSSASPPTAPGGGAGGSGGAVTHGLCGWWGVTAGVGLAALVLSTPDGLIGNEPGSTERDQGEVDPQVAPVAPVAKPRVAETTPAAGSTAAAVVAEERAPVRAGHRPASTRKGRSAASSLPEENRLIELAQRALGSGAAEQAAQALDDHASRFPRGQHAELREALRVRTLLVAGRVDDARAALRRFDVAYPGSGYAKLME